MKKTPLIFAVFCGWFVLLATFVLLIVIRVNNAAMTETQLFLKYWSVYAGCIPVVYIGYSLITIRDWKV
jgi:hypothetical protein